MTNWGGKIGEVIAGDGVGTMSSSEQDPVAPRRLGHHALS